MKKNLNKATKSQKKGDFEGELKSRINRVQGQLDSTKRHTKEEKALLMLELHSARRALESINRFIILDDAELILEHFREVGDKVGMKLAGDLIEHLNQKSLEV